MATQKRSCASSVSAVISLLYGSHLRAGGSKYKDLREGRLALLPGLTAPTQKLLHALMAPDPADRPSAAKVRCLHSHD